jgi:probable rRNA maturation factor
MAGACRAAGDAVSVVFVSDRRMAEMNRQFTGRAGSTDVLSFPGEKDPLEKKTYLGDIVICTARAEAQARERRIETGQEIKTLLIHGFLHLLGYDHGGDAGRGRMRRLEKKLFREMDIKL